MCIYKVYTKETGLVETDDHFDFTDLTWHRGDGPAIIEYHENGNIRYEEYWVNGRRHRFDGPAIIVYNANGDIIYESYFINDIEYSKENYHKELLNLKVQSL